MSLFINTKRTDDVAAKAKARAEQIAQFNETHISILRAKSQEIINWGKEAGAKGIDIDNIYSTHMHDEAYTDKAKMAGRITLDIPVKKNWELQNSKLIARFKELTGFGIQAEGYGRSVQFHIWF